MSATHGQAAARTRALAIVAAFHAVLRAARIYRTTNQVFQDRLNEMLALVRADDADETSLVCLGGQIYLDGDRVRSDPSRLPAYHGLMAELERRGLAGVRFMRDVAAAELEAFLRLFLDAATPEAGATLPDRVAEAGVLHVVPVREQDLQGETEPEADATDGARVAGERGHRVYWRSVLGARRLLRRTAASGKPALRDARRLVQPVVDQVLREDYSVVGLTALKDHDYYTYAHCVNVSVLSVGIGHALGLPREDLAQLGVAALLHDVGKVTIPPEVLRKPGALSAEEWRLIQRHPIEGVRILTRMPGLTPLGLETMRVCLEHHLKLDRTGYPRIERAWSMSTFARIVAVADCFDAITAHRSYRSRPYTAFEALQYMLGPEREQFDPLVLWGLVRTVGVYPAGSVLLTESNHLVLSVSPSAADVGRPRCRVLVRPDGSRPLANGSEWWDPMPEAERVRRVLTPEEHPFPVSELLAA